MKTKFFFASMLLACASFVVNAQGYKDGIDFYKIGKLDDAKVILEKNLANASNQAEAYYYLGEIAYHKGDLGLAKSYYDKGIAADAKYPFNYVGQGAVALKGGDVKGAEKLFKQAEKLSKKNPKLAIAIANAYYYTNTATYAKQIKKHTDNAFKWNPSDPDYYIFMGDDFGYKKEWGKAYGQYELAFNNEPTNIESHVKAANVDVYLNPERALKGLEDLLAQVPNNALVQRELAEKYYEHDNVAKALEYYGKYYDNPNHFVKDELRYAQLLWMNKQNDRAIEVCNGIIANPENEQTNKFLANRLKLYSQCSKEDWEGAVATADSYFNFPGENTYLVGDYQYYATALNKLDRADEAEGVFEKALELFPDNKDIRTQLVNTYFNKKENDKLAKLCESFIESGNYSGNDLYNLITAYCRLGEAATDPAVKNEYRVKAQKVADDLIAMQPDDLSNYQINTRVALLAETKKYDGCAIDAYKRLEAAVDAHKDNKNAVSYYKLCYQYLSNSYRAMGQVDKAKPYFEKWLQLEPNNEDLRKLVGQLNQQ